jgi:hypothetical protein
MKCFHGSTVLMSAFVMCILGRQTHAQDFAYTNENESLLSGFVVDSNGGPHKIAGSPFLTGGFSRCGQSLSANA